MRLKPLLLSTIIVVTIAGPTWGDSLADAAADGDTVRLRACWTLGRIQIQKNGETRP